MVAGNSELLRILKTRMVNIYPGFINVRITTSRNGVKKYRMTYMTNGLLVAGECDVPMRMWSFYKNVEEFYSIVVGDGLCVIVD